MLEAPPAVCAKAGSDRSKMAPATTKHAMVRASILRAVSKALVVKADCAASKCAGKNASTAAAERLVLFNMIVVPCVDGSCENDRKDISSARPCRVQKVSRHRLIETACQRLDQQPKKGALLVISVDRVYLLAAI
jgi:hypothetical protein